MQLVEGSRRRGESGPLLFVWCFETLFYLRQETARRAVKHQCRRMATVCKWHLSLIV